MAVGGRHLELTGRNDIKQTGKNENENAASWGEGRDTNNLGLSGRKFAQ